MLPRAPRAGSAAGSGSNSPPLWPSAARRRRRPHLRVPHRRAADAPVVEERLAVAPAVVQHLRGVAQGRAGRAAWEQHREEGGGQAGADGQQGRRSPREQPGACTHSPTRLAAPPRTLATSRLSSRRARWRMAPARSASGIATRSKTKQQAAAAPPASGAYSCTREMGPARPSPWPLPSQSTATSGAASSCATAASAAAALVTMRGCGGLAPLAARTAARRAACCSAAEAAALASALELSATAFFCFFAAAGGVPDFFCLGAAAGDGTPPARRSSSSSTCGMPPTLSSRTSWLSAGSFSTAPRELPYLRWQLSMILVRPFFAARFASFSRRAARPASASASATAVCRKRLPRRWRSPSRKRMSMTRVRTSFDPHLPRAAKDRTNQLSCEARTAQALALTSCRRPRPRTRKQFGCPR